VEGREGKVVKGKNFHLISRANLRNEGEVNKNASILTEGGREKNGLTNATWG